MDTRFKTRTIRTTAGTVTETPVVPLDWHVDPAHLEPHPNYPDRYLIKDGYYKEIDLNGKKYHMYWVTTDKTLACNGIEQENETMEDVRKRLNEQEDTSKALGAGTFGGVRLALDDSSGEWIVIKMPHYLEYRQTFNDLVKLLKFKAVQEGMAEDALATLDQLLVPPKALPEIPPATAIDNIEEKLPKIKNIIIQFDKRSKSLVDVYDAFMAQLQVLKENLAVLNPSLMRNQIEACHLEQAQKLIACDTRSTVIAMPIVGERTLYDLVYHYSDLISLRQKFMYGKNYLKEVADLHYDARHMIGEVKEKYDLCGYWLNLIEVDPNEQSLDGLESFKSKGKPCLIRAFVNGEYQYQLWGYTRIINNGKEEWAWSLRYLDDLLIPEDWQDKKWRSEGKNGVDSVFVSHEDEIFTRLKEGHTHPKTNKSHNDLKPLNYGVYPAEPRKGALYDYGTVTDLKTANLPARVVKTVPESEPQPKSKPQPRLGIYLSNGNRGTVRYLPPGIYDWYERNDVTKVYSPEADVYAAGIVLAELHGLIRFPLQPSFTDEIFSPKDKNAPRYSLSKRRGVPPELYKLIKEMLVDWRYPVRLMSLTDAESELISEGNLKKARKSNTPIFIRLVDKPGFFKIYGRNETEAWGYTEVELRQHTEDYLRFLQEDIVTRFNLSIEKKVILKRRQVHPLIYEVLKLGHTPEKKPPPMQDAIQRYNQIFHEHGKKDKKPLNACAISLDDFLNVSEGEKKALVKRLKNKKINMVVFSAPETSTIVDGLTINNRYDIAKRELIKQGFVIVAPLPEMGPDNAVLKVIKDRYDADYDTVYTKVFQYDFPTKKVVDKTEDVKDITILLPNVCIIALDVFRQANEEEKNHFVLQLHEKKISDVVFFVPEITEENKTSTQALHDQATAEFKEYVTRNKGWIEVVPSPLAGPDQSLLEKVKQNNDMRFDIVDTNVFQYDFANSVVEDRTEAVAEALRKQSHHAQSAEEIRNKVKFECKPDLQSPSFVNGPDRVLGDTLIGNSELVENNNFEPIPFSDKVENNDDNGPIPFAEIGENNDDTRQPPSDYSDVLPPSRVPIPREWNVDHPDLLPHVAEKPAQKPFYARHPILTAGLFILGTTILFAGIAAGVTAAIVYTGGLSALPLSLLVGKILTAGVLTGPLATIAGSAVLTGAASAILTSLGIGLASLYKKITGHSFFSKPEEQDKQPIIAALPTKKEVRNSLDILRGISQNTTAVSPTVKQSARHVTVGLTTEQTPTNQGTAIHTTEQNPSPQVHHKEGPSNNRYCTFSSTPPAQGQPSNVLPQNSHTPEV